MVDHADCPRCHGDGYAMVKRITDRDYGPCELCDGFGKECPPA
jgi:DnaJ-class molecular chaperone